MHSRPVEPGTHTPPSCWHRAPSASSWGLAQKLLTHYADCTWTGSFGNDVSYENHFHLCGGSAWSCSLTSSASKPLICSMRAGHLGGERLTTPSVHPQTQKQMRSLALTETYLPGYCQSLHTITCVPGRAVFPQMRAVLPRISLEIITPCVFCFLTWIWTCPVTFWLQLRPFKLLSGAQCCCFE